MNLSKLAVKRPVTIVMLTMMVLVLGFISLTKLQIDLFPEIQVPVAVVHTQYSGVGSKEIESLVTRPLEETLGRVNNIKSMQSLSSEGQSLVILEFEYGLDMDFASLEVREKVDLIKGFLPEDCSDPMVIRIDPNAMPIMGISLKGDKDLASLQRVAEDIIKPRLERMDGVASISVSGGYDEQVEILLNQDNIDGYGLDINMISNILRAENINLPAGTVTKGKQELAIRGIGEFESIEELKSLPIALPSGGIVTLADIADIRRVNKDISSIVKTNGEPSINLSIQKQSGKNIVRVADKLNAGIHEIIKENPDLSIDVVYDQSAFIKSAIVSVMKNAVIGGLLAVIILYLFLRNIRTTLIIGTAIPISIIGTFVLIYFNNITLNMMTIGGLALGVGMLVDNAIVVLENIYRFRQDGYSRVDAAIKGAKEVSMAVTASTLTTIAVFAPMVFVGGVTSALFKEFALTVTMSLFASLVVSLTLIPMLCSKYLRKEDERKKFKVTEGIYKVFDKGFDRITRRYKRILAWSLRHKKSVIAIGLGIFILSIALMGVVGAEFFPSSDEGRFSVDIELPIGTELNETEKIVTEITTQLEKVSEVTTIFASIGTSNGNMMNIDSTNIATLDVVLSSVTQRERGIEDIIAQVRLDIKDIPGAEIEVKAMAQGFGAGGAAPITIRIMGDDLDRLKDISLDFKDIISKVEGTTEVKSGFEDGIPELQLRLDRTIASRYGLTASQVANAVKSNISGMVATKFKLDGDEIDIVLKGEEIYKSSVANLKQTPIKTPTGATVTLGQLVDLNIGNGPVTITRNDQVRTVSVTSHLMDRDLGSVVKDINAELNAYNIPYGYSFEIGGQSKDMMEAFKDLFLALLLAILLVYMVIASQFESLIHPFTIMFSVPLALSGGVIGLFLTRRLISVPSIIGVIMLSGIVVNNAIVLVDYINTRRAAGEEIEEAILNAGPIRLRPILMTTLTTVIGLMPLALGIGEGAETQAPMATVVIGGLLLSTLLTLVFIPVMYTIFDRFRSESRKKRKKAKQKKAI